MITRIVPEYGNNQNYYMEVYFFEKKTGKYSIVRIGGATTKKCLLKLRQFLIFSDGAI